MSTVASNGTKTAPPVSSSAYMAGGEVEPQKGGGWIVFATTMIFVASFLNFIWGIAAVSSSKFFVANTHYILSGLNTWGWVVMGIGALQLLAAISVWRGGAFGRWFGITIACLSVLGAMLSIPAYPFWSLTLVALDILVIYGLAVYGGKPELTR